MCDIHIFNQASLFEREALAEYEDRSCAPPVDSVIRLPAGDSIARVPGLSIVSKYPFAPSYPSLRCRPLAAVESWSVSLPARPSVGEQHVQKAWDVYKMPPRGPMLPSSLLLTLRALESHPSSLGDSGTRRVCPLWTSARTARNGPQHKFPNPWSHLAFVKFPEENTGEPAAPPSQAQIRRVLWLLVPLS